jgi:uncharacterized protein HemX
MDESNVPTPETPMQTSPATVGDIPLPTTRTLMDDKWERMKWILTYCGSGGLAIVLTLALGYILIKMLQQSQNFQQTQDLDTLKESTAIMSKVAENMEDTSDAMKQSAEAQSDFATQLERLTITIQQDQETDEELTDQIKNLLEEMERDERRSNDRAENPPVVNP